MATTKITGKQIKFTTAQAFTGSGGSVSNGMIFDNGTGLVLSGMRIYTAQLTPDSNNEVASKKYVDDNIGGGSLQSGSVAFGQVDGSGFVGDGDFQYLTGSAGFGGGLFYGDMQAIGDSNGPKIRAALTDGAIPGVGTGSIAFNVARVYLTGSAQVALKSGDNLVLEAADDVTLTTTSADGEIQFVTAHTAGRAVFIDANANAGSIVDIDAGILDIDVTGEASMVAGGAIILSGAADSFFTTTKPNTRIEIGANGTGSDLFLNATGSLYATGSANVGIKSGDNLALEAADDITLTTTSADGEIQFVTAHTAGRAVFIDANANAGSIVDIDAGILDIDVTGEASMVAGGAIILSGAADSFFTTTKPNTRIEIGANGTGSDLFLNATGSLYATGSANVGIKSGDNLALEAADDITLTTTSADGEIQFVTAHTAGRAVFIDANANAGSIVDIDAGILDIDATGAVTIDSSAGAISIGADDIDQAINIGTDGTRTITIGEAADSTISIKSLGGTLTLDGTGQTVDLNSAALDIDASGAIAIDGASTFSVDAVGTSNVTTNGALTISGSTGLSLGADDGVITVSSRIGFITGSAAGVLIGASVGDMNLSATTFLGLTSGKALSIAAADGGISVTAGAGDAVNVLLGSGDGTETFAVRNNVGTAALTVNSGLGTTFGAGTVDISAAAALLSPAYVDNCASVTAPASGSTGYTNGTVVNGTGIAEIYYSGSLHNGQSIFLTGGLGANSLYSNSLRVFNNGILLLSGASNDYTTNVILTGASNAYGALRVDFVAQPLVDGDVLQFHARAKLAV